MKNNISYGQIAQVFHCLSALLILGLWPLGFSKTNLANEIVKQQFYQANVAIGIFVFLLTIFRVIWHFIDKYPEEPEGLSPQNVKAFKWIHNLLYVLIFLMASSGIAMLILSGIELKPGLIDPSIIVDTPPRISHAFLSKILAFLFVAHIGGLIRYQLIKAIFRGECWYLKNLFNSQQIPLSKGKYG